MYFLFIIAIVLIVQEFFHRKTAYYQVTKTPYLFVRLNLGRYGEYLTYKNLRYYEKEGAKFLFNLYIPKDSSRTTEIDVLMISPKGLFIFESKNYSGWIFGSENQRNWYQTLPQGRGHSHKESFYNPIMQNRTHIKHLKALLEADMPMRSIIAFSDRCTLKNVTVTDSDVRVINRCNVYSVVSSIIYSIPQNLLDEHQIAEIYKKLHPYTQVDSSAKAKHVADVQKSSSSTIAHTSVQEPMYAQPIYTAQQFTACPKCGGTLVLRTAKQGEKAGNQFYGCSNFPKCRYIKNLDKEPTI